MVIQAKGSCEKSRRKFYQNHDYLPYKLPQTDYIVHFAVCHHQLNKSENCCRIKHNKRAACMPLSINGKLVRAERFNDIPTHTLTSAGDLSIELDEFWLKKKKHCSCVKVII